MRLRPRTLADYGVYVLPVTVSAAAWWWINARTGHDEAWDTELFWNATLVVAFGLGLLLGSSRIVVPGVVIAALMWATYLVAVLITSDGDGAQGGLYFVAVFMWPFFTAFVGLVRCSASG